MKIANLEVERPKEGLEIEMDDGTIFTLQDPKAMRLTTLVGIESLPRIEQVKALIADGKFEEFAARPEVDGYFFEGVMKAYAKHFGIGSLGEGIASPRS